MDPDTILDGMSHNRVNTFHSMSLDYDKINRRGRGCSVRQFLIDAACLPAVFTGYSLVNHRVHNEHRLASM